MPGRRSGVKRGDTRHYAGRACCCLQGRHVFGQIGVAGDVGELGLDIGGVDDDRVAPALLGLEADVLEQLLQHGREPAGADILDLAVHLGGDPGDRADAVLGELDLDAFGGDQRAILLGQAGPGVGEDADEILLGQRLQLDPDRQPALQLGEQVASAWRRGTRPRR